MSRRGKTIVIVDVIVLVALIVGTVLFVTLRDRGESSNFVSTPVAPQQPHVSGAFFQWGPDVCPSFQFFDHLADAQLPGATKNQVCFREDNTAVAVGMYDDQAKLDGDLGRRGAGQHYATGTDDSDQRWLFLVLQGNQSVLSPLSRYGFTVH